MSLVPWNQFGDLDSIARNMNSFFGGFPFGYMDRISVPRVDVYQTDRDVELKAEIPGVSKEDLEVYIDEHSVRLTGQTRRSSEYNEKNIYRTERSYGSFSRTIPMPVEIKPDKAKAEYKDGILSITVPKSEPSKGKCHRVDIQ